MKIIEEGLEVFLKGMGFNEPDKLPEEQLKQLTLAFFSGSAYMFSYLTDTISMLSDDEGFKRLTQINDEIVEYRKKNLDGAS